MLSKFLMISAFFLILTCGEFSPALSQTNQCGDTDKFKDLSCKKKTLYLIDDEKKNPIEIRIYTKKANSIFQRNRTFIVVHNNEEKGLNAVKEVFLESGYGGRLIQVVSNYKSGFTNFKEPGNERRYLYFGDGKYCVDPNRIYTEAGRLKALQSIGKRRDEGRTAPICEGTPYDLKTLGKLKEFADQLLEIIKHNEDKTEQYSFIVGVHNNDKNKSLNIAFWLSGEEQDTAVGVIGTNYIGTDKKLTRDDFILVSNKLLFQKFFDARNPFNLNIALQQPIEYLLSPDVKDNLDDGSMSIYFGTTKVSNTNFPYSYMNIEAGGKSKDEEDASKKWQKDMIKKTIKTIL